MNRTSPQRTAFLAGLILLWACGLRGQIPIPPNETVALKPRAPAAADSSPQPDGLFRIDVAATDATGKPVTDLAGGEFTLLDNGQPTRILSLHGSASEPERELIFLLDTLNLSSQQLGQTESAITRFLRRNGGRLEFPCFLYRLTREGLFALPAPRLDGNLLANELEQKRTPWTVWRTGQRTLTSPLGSWDAGMRRNQLSLRALGSIAIEQRDVPGRKVLVWVGPGWPVDAGNNGLEEATELSTRLREARITVENVNVWWNPENAFDGHYWRNFLGAPLSEKDMRPEKMELQVIATHTGGLVLQSGAEGDLEPSIERCAADARNYYTLTFNPPRTSEVDEYRELGIQVGRPGITVRAPTGYYNEPVYFDHPRPGVEKVTVTQLEQLVHSGQDLGHRLANLEVTERVSTPRLDALLAVVHGERERQALIAAADLSLAFPPPPDEVVNRPPPAIEEQEVIIQRAFDYLQNSMPKLPDFFALRNTVRYGEPPLRSESIWKVPPVDQTLHFAASEHATVLYRNGKEVIEKKQKLGKHPVSSAGTRNLETRGTFGPILAYVLSAAASGQSTLKWERWERSKDGDLAVFSYSISSPNLLHEVTYCCLPEGNGTTVYQSKTGAYGEFGLNPDTGAIMRIVITADLDEDRDPTSPLIRSQVMVEYGPQELGGQNYICPQRSVSISRGRTVRDLHEWEMTFRLYSYFETMINDVTFGGYHKFGSEARILAGFEETQEPKPAAPPSHAH